MSDLLKITTLGGLSLQCSGEPIRGFVSRKVDALLVYLAANPREHPREVLGEMLWDDLPQNRTMSYLRTALSSLQQQLSPYLIVTRQTISIDPESNYWLDIQELESVMDASDAEWEQRNGFSRLTAKNLEQAINLYQGTFLEGFHIRDARGFEGWMILEQERLRNRTLEAMYRLGEYYLERAQHSTGIATMTRMLQLDPLSEQAHRLLMQMLAQSGQRSAAIAQFEHGRQILEDELGVEPEQETIELYEKILAGEVSTETPSSTPHNLPTPVTPFIDRPTELRQITEQLDRVECRLLTIVGTGGIGKTRLALEAAHQLLPDYPQGIYFVSCAPLDRAQAVIRAIANTLNISAKGDSPLLDELIHYLRNQEILLILDNFEHLVDGADILSQLLDGTPGLKLLVTSRERLNLQEEWLYQVEALSCPESLKDPNALRYPSIKLFVQSVQRVQPDFDAEAEVQPIIQICQLVDGMPLAIELAASWARVMTCDQIVDEITQSLDFLSTTLRNIPERHRSLRAVFDSSWHMLEDEEQRVLRQLSIFRGGFHPDAARKVTAVSLLTLSGLVDKSLLTLVNGRYQIHELLRQYAHRKLADNSEELRAVRAAHSIYFAGYMEARETRLTNNRTDSTYSEVIQEVDNVVAGWQFALENSDHKTIGRFMRPIYRLLDIQSRYLDGEQIFKSAAERLGASLDGGNNVIQARALLLRASCLQTIARYDEAEHLVNVALPTFRSHESPWELRIALASLGAIVYARGEYRQAQALFEEAYALIRKTGGDPVIMLLRLSDIATVLGEYQRARSILEDALNFLKDSSGKQSQMRFLLTLGDINLKLGDFDEARKNFEEARQISIDLEATNSGAVAYVSLARTAFAMGNYEEAAELCRQSISMFETIHNKWGRAFALLHLGKINHKLGNHAEAKHQYRTGLEIADEVGSPWLTSATMRQLAQVNRLLGNEAEARKNLLDSLRIALEIKALPLAMDAIAGIADIQAQEYPEQAARSAAFVVNQPVSEFETRQAAQRTLDNTATHLPPDMLDHIQAEISGQSIEDMAHALLENSAN